MLSGNRRLNLLDPCLYVQALDRNVIKPTKWTDAYGSFLRVLYKILSFHNSPSCNKDKFTSFLFCSGEDHKHHLDL